MTRAVREQYINHIAAVIRSTFTFKRTISTRHSLFHLFRCSFPPHIPS